MEGSSVSSVNQTQETSKTDNEWEQETLEGVSEEKKIETENAQKWRKAEVAVEDMVGKASISMIQNNIKPGGLSSEDD